MRGAAGADVQITHFYESDNAVYFLFCSVFGFCQLLCGGEPRLYRRICENKLVRKVLNAV